MDKIREKAKRLISPNLEDLDDHRITQTLRYEDNKECNYTPGAAEISYEMESETDQSN
jgi:hypothetical protein